MVILVVCEHFGMDSQLFGSDDPHPLTGHQWGGGELG
jgi:hypothetical protein